MSQEAPAVTEQGKLTKLAVALKNTGLRLDELAKAKKDLDAEYDQIAVEIKNILEAEGQESVKVKDVGTVYLQGKTSARIPAENKGAFIAWLDERGLGDLAPRGINAQTFAAQYREWEENDKPLPPAELVTVYREVTARLKSA